MEQKKENYDLEDLLPVGEDSAKVIFTFIPLLLGCTLYSMQFFYYFHRFLWEQKKQEKLTGTLIEMEYFVNLTSPCFLAFHLMFYWYLYLVGLYYYRHFSESKSIYLMRRLGNPQELQRRIWAIPLIFTTITCIIMVVLLLFYYFYYSVFGVNIPENQLEYTINLCIERVKHYVTTTRNN